MRNKKGQFVDGTDGQNTRFQPGHDTWNKGKTGYMGANATSFKKGHVGPATKPMGTVSRRENKGVPEYVINIDWHGNRKPNNSYKWYLWEVLNQHDRPEGMVLWMRNGNPEDVRAENFELISRGELARRNRS